MRKSTIPYLVVLFVIAAPIGENMLSRMQFAIAQGQEELSQQPSTSGGGLSINRSSDSSINGPLSQDMVIAGSFGDDRIEGSNTSDIITDQSVKYKYITKALPWWRWMNDKDTTIWKKKIHFQSHKTRD